MGKNYLKELKGLNNIYASAMKSNIDPIVSFISKYRTCPLIGVGSGGSYSTAAVFEFLCIRAGLIAQKMTPLELGQLHCQLSKSAAILFTAGGSNNDSKNSYKYLTEMEPEGILTCCMRRNAPIKQIQKNNIHNFYFEYEMPVRKDGYLAVESLFSATILLIRAFYIITHDSFFLLPENKNWNIFELDKQVVKEINGKESILILHGGITTPAAIDLQTKFSEVALGNTQLVDFRNFAHGRHYWLSNRKETTAIISLVGSSQENLVNKTLGLLPKEIPVLRLNFDDTSANGIIEALYYCFWIIGLISDISDFDPGRPHIDDFGRKLYHLNYDIGKRKDMNLRRINSIIMAAYRKSVKQQGIDLAEYVKYSTLYWKNLTCRKYCGIVFDYDGTLHNKYCNDNVLENKLFKKIEELLANNIKIGIATGRGKSVREELKNKISSLYWEKVVIAYYNGGVIGTLDDNSKPNKKQIDIPIPLNEALSCINDENIEPNPYQITLLKDDMKISVAEFDSLKEKLLHIKGIKVIETYSSIDVVPIETSKKNIFSMWDIEENAFLTIGDSGCLGANDYDLLCCNNALSVDYVSNSLESCWNYAKPGMRNLEATEYYLNLIEIQENGKFILKG